MRAGITLVLVLAGLAMGCRSTAEPPWGACATLRPPNARVRCAFLDAVTDPQTVVPAAAALVFGLTDWDDEVSDWARRETPVFGSTSGAKTGGEILLGASAGLALGTALATPSGCCGAEIRRNKLKGFGAETLAVGGAAGLAFLGKYTIGRERPNGTDDLSFPSGHATTASALSVMTWRNSDWLCTTPKAKTALKATATGVALLTGWSRVEAGAHFPSDIFAGHALGNLTGRFVHDSLLGRRGWQLRTGWRRDRGTITLGVSREL